MRNVDAHRCARPRSPKRAYNPPCSPFSRTLFQRTRVARSPGSFAVKSYIPSAKQPVLNRFRILDDSWISSIARNCLGWVLSLGSAAKESETESASGLLDLRQSDCKCILLGSYDIVIVPVTRYGRVIILACAFEVFGVRTNNPLSFY